MSFQKLIEDMQALAKSSAAGAADDAAIKAAAAAAGVETGGEGGGEGGEGELSADQAQAAADAAAEAAGDAGGESAADGDAAAGAERDESNLTKSFSFTLEDGTVVEALDGADLVKSLMQRMNDDKAEMVKALGMSVDLIKSQAAQLETMSARITTLSAEGRGRKSAVSISEKTVSGAPDLQKSQQAPGLTRQEFFAKADAAQKAGRITAAEIGLAETYLNKGSAIPAHIINRVMG
jgi:hypothetical protein